MLPCYHLTSQLPHDSCLCRYPKPEYPDAVTFVSYVAAYLRPLTASAFGAQLREVFKLMYPVRLSSAGCFLYGSPKALLVLFIAFEHQI